VSRYLPDRRTAPSQRWRTFLANHLGALPFTSKMTWTPVFFAPLRRHLTSCPPISGWFSISLVRSNASFLAGVSHEIIGTADAHGGALAGPRRSHTPRRISHGAVRAEVPLVWRLQLAQGQCAISDHSLSGRWIAIGSSGCISVQSDRGCRPRRPQPLTKCTSPSDSREAVRIMARYTMLTYNPTAPPAQQFRSAVHAPSWPTTACCMSAVASMTGYRCSRGTASL
jgi:hypothetical protein